MFSDLTPVATLPTADVAKAKKFYEETLGLTPTEAIGGTSYSCGNGMIFVYESAFAGSNKATAASFYTDLDKFDAEIQALRDKGVSFMTFEMEGLEWQDGVAVMGPAKSVWFADPDGNILNVSAGEM
jgi:catechol 2,3-dioxygenase-like lactoylglutathione lyase family enzyme